MNIFIHTIFPEMFDSFLNTSLIKKAIEKQKLNIKIINIRDFSNNKHKQIDDTIYGGGAGMLIKAQPVIESIEQTIKQYQLEDFKIIFFSPSKEILNQKKCFEYSKNKNIILLAGRYEGIDYRVEKYFNDKYGNFEKLSIGKYILMGGELASMVFIESVGRLVNGVIKEENSHLNDSYNIQKQMENIEHPQYTKPYEVFGYKVPKVLLSGHDKKIKERKENNEIN